MTTTVRVPVAGASTVEAAARLLMEGGYDPERIRTERFGPS